MCESDPPKALPDWCCWEVEAVSGGKSSRQSRDPGVEEEVIILVTIQRKSKGQAEDSERETDYYVKEADGFCRKEEGSSIKQDLKVDLRKRYILNKMKTCIPGLIIIIIIITMAMSILLFQGKTAVLEKTC